jgi:hypothetical protein
MEHRNLSFFIRDPLSCFLAGTTAEKKEANWPEFAFFNFLETIVGTGCKGFGSPGFADLPDEKKGSKESPPGDFAKEGKRIEWRGTRK